MIHRYILAMWAVRIWVAPLVLYPLGRLLSSMASRVPYLLSYLPSDSVSNARSITLTCLAVLIFVAAFAIPYAAGTQLVERSRLIRRVVCRLSRFGTGVGQMTLMAYCLMFPLYFVAELTSPTADVEMESLRGRPDEAKEDL